MASTYSTSLGLELIGQGEQSGTWGITTNNNFGTLVEQAITGVQTITMSNAQYTLSFYQGASDEARNAVLVLTGTNTAPQNLIAPAVNKTYIVNNESGATVTIKTSGGNGFAILNNSTALVYCDGTNFYSASPSLNAVVGDLTVSGNVTAGSNVTAVNGNFSGNVNVTGTLTAGSIAGVTGRIRQIVNNTWNTYSFTGSTGFVDTYMTLPIVPTSANSSILVMTYAVTTTQGYSNNLTVGLNRNGSQVGQQSMWVGDPASAPYDATYNLSFIQIDKPNSTSTVNYTVQIKSTSGGGVYYGTDPDSGLSSTSSMVLMEIL
jgi:hypothetical protein